MKAKADAKRNITERFADWTTGFFGSIPFLIVHFLWFVTWIALNNGALPGFKPFDPFPYGLLTMIVSLEAIFLSIFVLLSQNRAGKIADLREEIDLQVDIITEREITKLIQMAYIMMEKMEVSMAEDKELKKMLKPLDLNKIESVLAREVSGDTLLGGGKKGSKRV